MIGYKFSRANLLAAIESTKQGWLNDAETKTEKFRKLRRYEETGGSWSTVKSVYMDFQRNKCPYCERKLESKQYGKIEWDLEHFRPKTALRRWPPANSGQSFDFPMGSASKYGYYLLAYHPLNYLASCKVCNSTFKSDYFPIAGKRRSFREGNPEKLLKEKAYIPYPLGEFDEDPESILTFQGYICVPSQASNGHKRRRALVTIELLGLNKRDTLLNDRSEMIVFTYCMLKLQEANPSDENANNFFQRLNDPGFRHANCARSFVQTFKGNRALADQYAEKAEDYLKSKGQ